MAAKPSLPLRDQWLYAIGQLGWSTLVNLIGLQLVFFYIPPRDAGIPAFIDQRTFFVVLNAIVLIAASGRLVDAITDPLIASWSDRSRNPRGRRVPFMRWGAAPAAIFCILMFIPPVQQQSSLNIVWLIVTQIAFYIALTVYVTPYFALLPELGHTAEERLNLSTWISITYALGIVLAAQAPVIAGALGPAFGLTDAVRQLQAAFALLGVIALALMLVPTFTLDEKKYSLSEPSSVPLGAALRNTFSNPHFRYYVIADFAYFMSITIIQTGLLFYVTVLLRQAEAFSATLASVMVVGSFLFYPLVNLLAKRTGKKVLVVASFVFMAVVFSGIYFLGDNLPLSLTAQGFLLVGLTAVPLAFLGVLPNAILSDIATHDAVTSGEAKEGMYFAARTLLQKFGQTFGVLTFAMLTTFGKDVGDDLGIRLSGLIGFALCAVAAAVFARYNERRLLQAMAEV